MNEKAIVGCILGTAVGDALGLPYEGMSPSRARRLLGPPSRHRFFFGRGMISDDTEHTCMVAQSLIESGEDVAWFSKRFASRLRWWMLAQPAGVGKATALSCAKLLLGFGVSRSGVYSAGNGPSMRAAIFGASIKELPKILEFVRASTRLTHTDPKAEFGAIAVALAAREACQHAEVNADQWLEVVSHSLPSNAGDFIELLRSAVASVAKDESTIEFAKSMGLERGVTGYTYHTVRLPFHCWLSSPDNFEKVVTTAIECGGDADTTAAIAGGIVGARVGKQGIPNRWLQNLWDWPRSVGWMEIVGQKLAQTGPHSPAKRAPFVNPIGVALRNPFFLVTVLIHGFRRIFPPYL